MVISSFVLHFGRITSCSWDIHNFCKCKPRRSFHSHSHNLKKRIKIHLNSHVSLIKTVFCFQYCSELLWEKIVLVIEKNFWTFEIRVWRARIKKKEITITIYLSSESSVQFYENRILFNFSSDLIGIQLDFFFKFLSTIQ